MNTVVSQCECGRCDNPCTPIVCECGGACNRRYVIFEERHSKRCDLPSNKDCSCEPAYTVMSEPLSYDECMWMYDHLLGLRKHDPFRIYSVDEAD